MTRFSTTGATIRRAGVCVAASAWALAACLASAADASALRTRLVLAAEPAGAVSITAAKQKLTTTPQPVVVAGRIGARGMEPFVDGKASFSLVEIPTDDHAAKPGHDADGCPFCKKRNANSPLAAVRFLGDDGKEIPVDARTLFGVKKGQDVVVRGTAIFDPKLGIPVIQVTADGIHVRPAAR